MRGYRLTQDDLLRRTVINRLLCHGVLHKSEIEREFGIDFDEYFAPEIARLAPFVEDGLLEIDGGVICAPRCWAAFSFATSPWSSTPIWKSRSSKAASCFQKRSDHTRSRFRAHFPRRPRFPYL